MPSIRNRNENQCNIHNNCFDLLLVRRNPCSICKNKGQPKATPELCCGDGGRGPHSHFNLQHKAPLRSCLVNCEGVSDILYALQLPWRWGRGA